MVRRRDPVGPEDRARWAPVRWVPQDLRAPELLVLVGELADLVVARVLDLAPRVPARPERAVRLRADPHVVVVDLAEVSASRPDDVGAM